MIPFCLKDVGLAKTLLQWVNELGRCENDCLLVADCKVQKPACSEIVALAESAFRSVTLISTPYSLPNEQWPYGPNWMFKTALKYIGEKLKTAFLWMEPDCTPLKRGWAETLESAYQKCGHPFMGAMVHSSGQAGRPGDHLTGCAIYPSNAYELLWVRLNERPEAFDMSTAPISVPLAFNSPLFFHSWGARASNDPAKISVHAVIHHQCKDGSLIQSLRQRK